MKKNVLVGIDKKNQMLKDIKASEERSGYHDFMRILGVLA
jgi:hypothetical protein